MRYSKIFVHSAFLFTVPPFILSPQANVYASTGAFQERSSEILPAQAQGTPLGISLDASLLSYDDILHFLEELENGELEKRCTPADLEQINHFLISLARQGLLSDDAEEQQILENDIQELLHGEDDEDDPYEYTLSFGHGGDYVLIPGGALYTQEGIILCKKKKKKGLCHKLWDHTKDFVKKNKKEVIIGAIVIVGAALIIGAVVAASAAATAAAAGAAGAATSGSDNEEKNKSTPKEEELASASAEILVEALPQTLAVINESPSIEAVIKEHMAEHISLFKESIETVASQSTERTFGEEARDLGAHITHEIWEGIAELGLILPLLQQDVNRMGSEIDRFLPLPPSGEVYGEIMPHPMKNYQEFVEGGHRLIDWVFSVEQTDGFICPKNKYGVDFVYGIIPFPGTFSQGPAVPKFKEVIKIGEEAVSVIEELGIGSRKVVQMAKPGALEKSVTNTLERFANEKIVESKAFFDRAEAFLKPHSGQYLQEIQIRELIQQSGIRTFPRPIGIPENYRIKLTDKSGGMKYVHPNNEGTYVRVMPGKPHSPNPCQREPYVNQRIDGYSLDKFGNKVPNDSVEAHIPINEFVFKQ